MANEINPHLETAKQLTRGFGPTAIEAAHRMESQARALHRCGRPADLVEAAKLEAAAQFIFDVINGSDEE